MPVFNTNIHTHTHACTYTHTHTRTHTQIHRHKHTHTRTQTHTHTHILSLSLSVVLSLSFSLSLSHTHAGSSSDTRRQTTTSDADALRAKDSEIAALHHRIKQMELLAHTASNPSLYLQVSLPAVGQGVLEQGAVGKMEGRDFNDRVRSSVPQAGGADSGDGALEATSKGTSKANHCHLLWPQQGESLPSPVGDGLGLCLIGNPPSFV